MGELSLLPRVKHGVNSRRSPDAVPAKAGNYIKELDSRWSLPLDSRFRGNDKWGGNDRRGGNDGL